MSTIFITVLFRIYLERMIRNHKLVVDFFYYYNHNGKRTIIGNLVGRCANTFQPPKKVGIYCYAIDSAYTHIVDIGY